MAQIIYLRPDIREVETKLPSGSDKLTVELENRASGVVLLGREVLTWVRQLNSCLGNLDAVANALEGSPQGVLQENVQLLRSRLSSAVVELNHKLQDLPAVDLSPAVSET
jgi:hypothetical protein